MARLLQWTALALAVPALSGCRGPQSALDPASATASELARLWWVMSSVAGLVLLLVSVLWLYALLRAPRQHSQPEAARIQRRLLIGGGLLLPTLSVSALLFYGVNAARGMLPLEDAALRVSITGHQWWWEVRYPQSGVVTANQLILPVGRPVDIEVTSADVIHAFWVPSLGGKLDMTPGRRGVVRLQADREGVFRGQCSEFCGTQHAHMILHVEALAEERFADWLSLREQRAAIAPPEGAAGALFAQRCGLCHRVAGVSEGQRAPDLSDLASRPTLGAGVIANDAAGLRRWLREHQRLKPGNGMPNHDDVDETTLDALAAWLEDLAP